MRHLKGIGLGLIGGILVVAILVFVTLKLYYPDIHDDSLITGDPCLLPCWHHLIPGQSTEADARAEIGQNVAIQSDSIETDHPSYMSDGSYSIAWKWKSNKNYGGAFWFQKDSTLDEISINPDDTLTVKDFLFAYGPPTFIKYLPVQEFNEILSRQPSGVGVSMVYFDRNIEVGWFEPTSESHWTWYCPNLDLPVSDITVFRPDKMAAVKDEWVGYPQKIKGANVYQNQNGKTTISCASVAPTP